MRFTPTLLPLLSIASLLSASAYAQEQVVKIGHVAPLSGQVAHLGKDNENGGRMAIDALTHLRTMSRTRPQLWPSPVRV